MFNRVSIGNFLEPNDFPMRIPIQKSFMPALCVAQTRPVKGLAWQLCQRLCSQALWVGRPDGVQSKEVGKDKKSHVVEFDSLSV